MHLKKLIKSGVIRKTNLYRNIKKDLLSPIDNYACESRLNAMLNYAKCNVEYYRDNYDSYTQYQGLPILRKKDIIGNEDIFISKKYSKCFLMKKSTGGTSGASLNLFKSFDDVIAETAFTDHAFELLDIEELNIAVLRGYKPKSGLFEYQAGLHILSSYDLSETTIEYYIEYLKNNNINCFHIYPSAFSIFCKYFQNHFDKDLSKQIKGIVSSSEILLKENIPLIKGCFPEATLVDIYGQNEHVAFAISINGNPYKFYPQYGYTELIDTGERLDNGNQIAEIVSCGYFDKAMPLLRYGIEDYVEIDNNGNILSIIGRTQDFLYNSDGERVPCIVLTRDKTLENVISFQYYQDTIGEVVFRVLVNENFSDIDKRYIIEDIAKTFSGKIIGKVEVVSNIEKTKAGKQKRLIQLLKYEN